MYIDTKCSNCQHATLPDDGMYQDAEVCHCELVGFVMASDDADKLGCDNWEWDEANGATMKEEAKLRNLGWDGD